MFRLPLGSFHFRCIGRLVRPVVASSGVLAVLGLSACAHSPTVEVEELYRRKRARQADCSLSTVERATSQSFLVRLARIRVRSFGNASVRDDLALAVQREACALGGDAVAWEPVEPRSETYLYCGGVDSACRERNRTFQETHVDVFESPETPVVPVPKSEDR